ncbi:unnamed protein product, partial [Owenia fusiformis]
EMEKMTFMPSEAALTLQNGQCGNSDTNVETATVPRRALCYPTSLKACCFKNHCQNMTVKQCQCGECLDLRQRLHAEKHNWQPLSNQCPLTYYDPTLACDMLAQKNVKHIILVGDSLVRHFFGALLILLSGHMKDGAMKQNTKPDDREKCGYHLQFDEKYCRKLNDRTRTICNSKVQLTLREDYSLGLLQKSVAFIREQKNQVILFSTGLHNGLNFEPTKVALQKYITDLGHGIFQHRSFTNHSRPRMLFMTPHYPGLMKRARYLTNHQGTEDVKIYSDKMRQFLARYNIPMFNTSALTSHTFSFDGTHFGYGLNVHLSHILLNYISQFDWDTFET